MKLYLDTADFAAVEELNSILTISGVTTNPSIIAGSKTEVKEVVRRLDEILNEDQKIFVQVIKTDLNGIMEEANQIMNMRKKNIYAKIPVSFEGLKAIKLCKAEGIPTLATAVYSADQAYMAALNGADSLAPYVNRMCNYGNGIQEVLDLVDMLKAEGLTTEIVAASFKNVQQVHELMKGGCSAATVGPDIVYQMIGHPGTQIAVDEFSEKWAKTFGRYSLLGE